MFYLGCVLSGTLAPAVPDGTPLVFFALLKTGPVRSPVVSNRVTFADRLVSVTAASNRAASAAKAGVGPFQRNWSTSSKSAMSVRSVASVQKSNACSRSRQRVSARALALAAPRLIMSSTDVRTPRTAAISVPSLSRADGSA